jgi:hypothetical protein
MGSCSRLETDPLTMTLEKIEDLDEERQTRKEPKTPLSSIQDFSEKGREREREKRETRREKRREGRTQKNVQKQPCGLSNVKPAADFQSLWTMARRAFFRPVSFSNRLRQRPTSNKRENMSP